MRRIIAASVIVAFLLSFFLGAATITFAADDPSPVASLEADSDGDGIINNEDPDIDGDGIVNGEDLDIDGDGAENFSDGDPTSTTGLDGNKPPVKLEQSIYPDGFDTWRTRIAVAVAVLLVGALGVVLWRRRTSK